MDVRYEPFSELQRDDPYPTYALLREHAPLHFAEEANVWCVSRHDDALAVLRSVEGFSSDAMRTVLMGARPGADPMTDPEALKRMMAFAHALPFSLQEMVTARNLISEDPPRHGPLRNIVNRGFTPRRIAAWEPRLREIVAECVAGLRGARGFDLIDQLAMPLPVRAISEMLGVEPERSADFKRWNDEIIAGLTGSGREEIAATGMVGALSELSGYLTRVVREREKSPGDDLISTLIEAQGGDAALEPAEVMLFVLLLLAAGNETTTNLLGNCVKALLAHPEQLERLCADPSLVPNAIEETLRWDGPVQIVFRRARRDVELACGTVPADATVFVLIGAANRDEKRWGPDAGAFRIDRDTQGHLGFGVGNHFCLGASLARLEARVALEALLDELPHLRRVAAPDEPVDSFMLRGPRHLPLERAA